MAMELLLKSNPTPSSFLSRQSNWLKGTLAAGALGGLIWFAVPQPVTNVHVAAGAPSGSNPIDVDRLPSGSQALPESVWSVAGASDINESRTLCYEDTGGLDTAATINTQIAGCGDSTYVLLQAGSYTFSTGIIMKQRTNSSSSSRVG